MALLQNSVLNKYLNTLNQGKVKEAYQKFVAYFQDKERIKTIKAMKEEEYQDGFLDELFVNVFGYTKKPNKDYNLVREKKNTTSAKKADGAILVNGDVVAVIELKSTQTADIRKIEYQAFGYKSTHPKCNYVITSNFAILRFYINDTTNYEDFYLFELTEERFQYLYLLLNWLNMESGIPAKMKEESVLKEDEITKQLYKDYSRFKTQLFHSIRSQNKQYEELLLFKKTQKLLDRILFILFAEDSGLLPPNSISRIIDRWNILKEEDACKPLYHIFKQYFSYFNIGRKGKKPADDIFAYNGGLFAPDEVLDNIVMSDNVLATNALHLSSYDFQTEVGVNILGHIFEHSLNEIEEIQAQIEQREIDKSKTKRKKEGVFYTPEYITKYIVENTVGKFCEEKKQDLGIDVVEYLKDRKRRKKAKLKELENKLDQYQDYLFSLRIVDPACGSGAFLNQAFNFLIEEHEYIAFLRKNLFGESIQFDVANDILEKNLYGVDINEESVEIAKLSLWLRTAKKGRKLTDLNNNIKCGNSLIDDPAVAGEKAFKWEEEFPQVFHPKDLQAFHVVLTTHNSRSSQRMMKHGIAKGQPVELNLEEEIQLTKIMGDIILEKGYKCLAYNICQDHVHLILVCEPEELSSIVSTIKGKSARVFNLWALESKGLKPLGRNDSREGQSKGLKPLGRNDSSADDLSKGFQPLAKRYHPEEHGNHLWSQKFFRANMDVWELAKTPTRPGYVYRDTHLGNAMAYILTNRQKHHLPKLPELEPIIDEMTCSEDAAFELQYKGGFDVVIGNPPYLRVQGLRENFEKESLFCKKIYQSATRRFDIYVLFIEKTYQLINSKGKVGMILPHKFMISEFGEGIRKFLSEKKAVESILHFGAEMVFQDSSTYTCILVLSKTPKQQLLFRKLHPKDIFEGSAFEKSDYSNFSSEKWNLQSDKIAEIFSKISNQPHRVKEIFKYISQGVVSVGDDIFLLQGEIVGDTFKGFSNKTNSEVEIEADIVKPLLKGEDVKKYAPLIHTYFVFYPHFEDNGKTKPYEEKEFKENFPKAFSYISPFKDELIEKKIRYKTNPKYWYGLHRSREITLFEQEKIVTPETSLGTNLTLDKDYYYHNTQVYSLVKKGNYDIDLKVLLAILNNPLFWFFLKSTGAILRGGYFRFKTKYFEPFPMPPIPPKEIQTEIITKVDIALSQNEYFSNISNSFQRLIARKFKLEKLPKALQNWHTLTFTDFVKQLKKKKIKLSLSEEAEWEAYFEKEKVKAQSIQQIIDATDKEIDRMVYELYGLTEEEVAIVEESV